MLQQILIICIISVKEAQQQPKLYHQSIQFNSNIKQSYKTKTIKEELQQMKKQQIDIDKLADAPNLQDYQIKPVQSYGMALLQGMGYTQGRGIGKRVANQLNDILVLKPRPKGLGLGAQMPEQQQKIKFEVGDRVLIVGQVHKGLTGLVNNIIDEKTIQIELHPSKSLIKSHPQTLKKISKQHQKKVLEQQSAHQDLQKKPKRLKWILPHIRIKVINPQSNLYLKKLIVSELISPKQFQCYDEKGNRFTSLLQSDVQTVIPKTNGTVIILKGEFKGEKAVVIDRKKTKNQVIVQTVEGMDVVRVPEDDVAEFVEK